MQMLAVAYHVERMQGGRGIKYLSYEMLLIHRMKPTPRGHSRVVAIRSDMTKTGDQGGVAGTLATSAKWGEQLAWCSITQPVRRSGHPDFGWQAAEGDVWGV